MTMWLVNENTALLNESKAQWSIGSTSMFISHISLWFEGTDALSASPSGSKSKNLPPYQSIQYWKIR